MEPDSITSHGLNQLFQRCTNLEVVRIQENLQGCEELQEALCNLRNLSKLEFWTVSESWKEDKLQSVAAGVSFNTHGFRAIPGSFARLTSLKTLHITLKENSTGHEVLFRMTHLEELHLESCANIFLGSLPNLTNLTELHLSMPIIVLPRATSRLVNLKDFRLFCNTMADNPSSLEQLTKLRIFSIVGPITSLPRFVATLPSLAAVTLVCPNLLDLPSSIQQWRSLKTLDLYRCVQLNELPSCVSSFSNLSRIAVGKCVTELAEILSSFSRLRRLDIQLNFVHKKLPDALSSLTQLRTLQIAACTKLSTLSNFLPALSSLQTLNIEHCRELSSLCPEIGNLTALKTLTLLACPKLQLPSDFGLLSSLEDLSLFQCGCLELPATLSRLKRLAKFMVRSMCPILLRISLDPTTLSPLEQHAELSCLQNAGRAWATLWPIYWSILLPTSLSYASSASHCSFILQAPHPNLAYGRCRWSSMLCFQGRTSSACPPWSRLLYRTLHLIPDQFLRCGPQR